MKEGRGSHPRLRAARSSARRLAISVLAVGLLAHAALADREICTAAETCRAELPLRSGGRIHYYRSLPIAQSASIRSAVIVIHGNSRDADRYFDRLVAAAAAEARLEDAILLAPRFRVLKDHPASNEHYWSSHGWKIGNKSLDPLRFGSFEVVDELLARVCPASGRVFPMLRRVALIGHSAGGQFVNRYVAGGRGCPDHAVEMRYVVMNPSSYLYIDARRNDESHDRFVIPETHCPDYDEYKYGLRDLNTYMKRAGVDRIRVNLFTRRTFYLAGESDLETGGSLDTRCAANLQGRNRFARHANYRRYSELFDAWTGSEFATIPGVAHDAGKMLLSETARRIIFR